MGTRAIITKNEKLFIATHWDGYPSGLGKDLIDAKTDKDILIAANKHSIDFAAKKMCNVLNKKRFQEIVDKVNKLHEDNKNPKRYTVEDLEKLHKEGKQLTFGVHCAGDSPISSIEDYSDFAEYQYDFTDGKWRYRELSGSWDVSKDSKTKFKPLTKSTIKNAR